MSGPASLDRGAFHLTFPRGFAGFIVLVVGALILVAGATVWMSSFSMLDVPDTGDLPDVTDFSDQDSGWVTADVTVTSGTLASGRCVERTDDEGRSTWHDETDANRNAVFTLQPAQGPSVAGRWHADLSPELNPVHRACPGTPSWTFGSSGVSQIRVLGEWESDGGRLLVVGLAEGAEPLPQISQREDRQRIGVLLVAIAFAVLTFAMPTSLSHDLRKIDKVTQPRAPIHWSPSEGLRQGHGPARPNDARDWYLPPTPPQQWRLDDPYGPDEPEEVLAEHPTKVGTPRPAMLTTYAVMAIISLFIFIGLIADVLGRQGGSGHRLFGMIVHGVFLVASASWLAWSFGQWRRVQLIQDTPTSLVRSVAAGPVELVGQVRPAAEGSMTVDVGHNSSRRTEGLVRYRWTYERYECRGTGKNRKCSWRTKDSDSGGSDFILHDGTGGILVKPNTFREVDVGGTLHRWTAHHKRWTLEGLSLGDPVYLLGEAESRPQAALDEAAKAHPAGKLQVKGTKSTGFLPRLVRGTELGLLSGIRSTAELLIVPSVAMVISLIPFIWY